jgi:aspartate-semialdehyde dehydrogenase
MPIVVMGHLPGDWDLMPPAAGPVTERTSSHLRVAHPALVVLWTLVGSLRYLDPVWGTVAALDPVSAGGAEDVERLARQAAQRLRGAEVEERIADQVLAFNLVAADDEDLNRDAAALLPDLDTTATRLATGCFHGNAAQVGIGFSSAVEEHEVMEALRDDERLAVPDLPLSLDSITESDLIGLSVPRLSRTGRQLSVTGIADGLRIGGARTALEILRSLL